MIGRRLSPAALSWVAVASLVLSSSGSWACAKTGLLLDVSESDEADGGRDAGADHGDGRNSCGGGNPLAAEPGATCGDCGKWVCEGSRSLRCVEEMARNRCGLCDPEPMEVCNGYDDDCDGSIDEGCVQRLATFGTSDDHLRISAGGSATGGGVVFDAAGRAGGRDVVYVPLDHPAEPRIMTPYAEPLGHSDDPSHEQHGAIGGDLIAWVVIDTGTVVIYDRRLRSTVAEFGAELGRADEPAIDDDRVVFSVEDRVTHEADIWQWTATGGFVMLTSADGRETAPDLSGDWLVYEKSPVTDGIFGRHIEAANLATGEHIVLSDGLTEGWHLAPAIAGQHVVWQNSTGSSSPSWTATVWAYDLATGRRRQISGEDSAFDPRVSDGRVCFTTRLTLPAGEGDWVEDAILLFDLNTDREARVADRGRSCDLEGRHLVYSGRFATATDPYYRLLDDGLP